MLGFGLTDTIVRFVAKYKAENDKIGEENLVVVELDRSLNTIRQNLNQSIDNATRSLNIRLNSLENQSNCIHSKIYSVPGQ